MGLNLARLEARLQQLPNEFENKELQVGIPTNAQYEDGTQIAYIGAIQEFGAPEVGIPPRRFFGPTIAAQKSNWVRAVRQSVKMAVANNLTAEDALDGVGALMSADIKDTIASIYDPKLKDGTLANRRTRGNSSAKPLVDTGALFDSITWAVNTKDAEFSK